MRARCYYGMIMIEAAPTLESRSFWSFCFHLKIRHREEIQEFRKPTNWCWSFSNDFLTWSSFRSLLVFATLEVHLKIKWKKLFFSSFGCASSSRQVRLCQSSCKFRVKISPILQSIYLAWRAAGFLDGLALATFIHPSSKFHVFIESMNWRCLLIASLTGRRQDDRREKGFTANSQHKKNPQKFLLLLRRFLKKEASNRNIGIVWGVFFLIVPHSIEHEISSRESSGSRESINSASIIS